MGCYRPVAADYVETCLFVLGFVSVRFSFNFFFFFTCVCDAGVGPVASCTLGKHPPPHPPSHPCPSTRGLPSMISTLSSFSNLNLPCLSYRLVLPARSIFCSSASITIVNTLPSQTNCCARGPECSSWCWVLTPPFFGGSLLKLGVYNF